MYTTDMKAVASTSALAYPATKDAAAKEREDRLLAAKKKVSQVCPRPFPRTATDLMYWSAQTVPREDEPAHVGDIDPERFRQLAFDIADQVNQAEVRLDFIHIHAVRSGRGQARASAESVKERVARRHGRRHARCCQHGSAREARV